MSQNIVYSLTIRVRDINIYSPVNINYYISLLIWQEYLTLKDRILFCLKLSIYIFLIK